MSEFNESSFPNLSVSVPLLEHRLDWFQNQIVEIFFELTRKKNESELNVFEMKLDNLMFSLKHALYNCDDSSEILKLISFFILLYKMIGYTRDIYSGKGERDLTYVMIYVWYKYFQIPALFSLHFLTKPIDGEYEYGSWKDIKYFCRFVMLKKGKDDPIIDFCVDLLNTQLIQDFTIWNSISKDSLELNPSKHNISMVCKWIPRENSAFDWLYQKCVLHWANTYKPQYFNTAHTDIQQMKARNKYKMEYRQICSTLNKAWDTPQIRQCNSKWADILPSSVSLETVRRQYRTFLNMNLAKFQENEDRILCSQHFRDYFNRKYTENGGNDLSKNRTCFVGNFHMQDTMTEFMSIFNKKNTEPLLGSRIQHNWNQMLNAVPHFDLSIIPVVHLSKLEESETALGIATFLSAKSKIADRMILYDTTATWVNTNPIDRDILNSMRNIFEISQGRGEGNNLFSALELLMMSFIQTNMSKQHVENIVLVILSDFANPYKELHSKIVSFFRKNDYPKPPSIIYWNISKNTDTKLMPCASNIPRTIMVSGDSSSLFYAFSKLSEKKIKETTAFSFLCELLNQPRYFRMEKYFKDLLI